MMAQQPMENGVLFASMTGKEQRYATLYLQVCRKYGIDPVKADDMEKDFLKKRVEYLLKEQVAI